MSTPIFSQMVPISLSGWRIWDLFAAHELHTGSLTRGIHVNLDRGGVVTPEHERHVTASELDMMLALFGDHALTFHVSTHADENRIPSLIDGLIKRYPALAGRTLQLNNQIRPNTCEAMLPVKKKHGLKLILPHFILYGADVWAASVALADQVLFDAGGLRGLAQLNLDERTVSALTLVTDVSKVPIALAGKLTPEIVHEMHLRIHEVRAILNRPFALVGDAELKRDGSLDLARAAKFHDTCAHILGMPVAAAA